MRVFYILLAFFICANSYAKEAISQVEVFTSRYDLVTQVAQRVAKSSKFQLIIYDVNAVKKWEQEFSKGLPNTESAAYKEVLRRIERYGGNDAFDKILISLYKPLTRSTELGLLEYPCVVINSKYVVKGTDDIEIALGVYNDSKN